MSKHARKTEDEIRIEANYGYGCGWEEVACEANWKDARGTIRLYRENEPGIPFRMRKVRVPKVESVMA